MLREQTVTYQIDRGPRHRFVHLGINGNRYFTLETIRERLYIQPAQFPRYPYGRYSPSYLRQDIQVVETLYRSNGFRDVEVTCRIVDNYRGRKNQIAVFVNIKEGRQWFVSTLDIEGASATDSPVLRKMLTSTEGQPYSEANVASDRDNVLNYYYNDGYPNATFEYLCRSGKSA